MVSAGLAAFVAVAVESSDAKIAQGVLVPASFSSVTVDYMPGVGVLDLNLSDPSFQELAAGLAPGLLRLGGSSCDLTVFGHNTSDCARAMSAGMPGNGSKFVCKGAPQNCLLASRWREWLRFSNITGLQLVLGLNGCFGRRDRDAPMDLSNAQAVLDFTHRAAAAEGAHLAAFELGNEMSECEAGTERWMPYNCTSYSSTRGVSASRWSDDAALLAEKIAAAWQHEGSQPALYGPDAAGLDSQYMATVANTPGLGAMTFHQYPQCVPPAWGCALANTSHACNSYGCRWRNDTSAASIKKRSHGECAWQGELKSSAENEADLHYVQSPDCLEQIPRLAHSLLPLLKPRGLSLIAGETAAHAFGGYEGVTDTFSDTFFYAYQLGTLAKLGLSALARQTLVGGAYALIGRSTGTGSHGKQQWQPRPDYWLARLWRRHIIGDDSQPAISLSVRVLEEKALPLGLSVFVFCSSGRGGNATGRAMIVNLHLTQRFELQLFWPHSIPASSATRHSQSTAEGEVTGNSSDGLQRLEWHVRGNVGRPNQTLTPDITINGISPNIRNIKSTSSHHRRVQTLWH